MNEPRLVENLAIAGPRAPRRRAALGPLAAAALAAAAPAALAQPRGPVRPPLKVAFVYVSPVSDAGWTHQHDAGRRELERAMAGRVTTTVVEKVAEGADAERVIRDLAAQGHPLVFATSFGFMDPTIRVAREFPDVAFEHASGYRNAANVGTYNARFYEGRYLAGIVAGRSTRSNAIGYVAAFPIPEVLQGINAFALGARSVNPKAEVRIVWTAAWFDPGRERDAAFALAGQGADVLTHHTDSSAVPQAAEARGVGVVGYHSDMSRAAPRTHLVSVTHHWGRHYVQRAQAVLDGTWTPGSVWGGLKDGMVRVDPFGASVPKDTIALVRAKEQDIVAGRLHPFAGPIRDNEGRLRLQQGPMSDADLNRIDWLVEGVAGRLPRS
ncbi:MAG TPA: BMP family ABC transporter substrate-binding protein [Burkholderiaceae bacterium]|nr:BMP family ABC transporter substrate-binding protein [Burkholderiaceae bacterium]